MDKSTPKPARKTTASNVKTSASKLRKSSRASTAAATNRAARLQLANPDDQLSDDSDNEKMIDATLKVNKYRICNLPTIHRSFPLMLVKRICKNIGEVLKHVPAGNSFVMFGYEVFIATTPSSLPFKRCKSNTTCNLSDCNASLKKDSNIGFAFIVAQFVDLRLADLETVVCCHHMFPSLNVKGFCHANRISVKLYMQDSGVETSEQADTTEQAASKEAATNEK